MARANDGGDDRQAIVNAINALKGNDTLNFGDGVYNISTPITTTKSDYTLQGTGNTTLKGNSSNGAILKLKGDRFQVRKLTFDGGGIFMDHSGNVKNTGIKIDYCVFKLTATGGQKNGITFTSGLKDSKVTNNYFTGYGGGYGMYGYNYENLTIGNNEFINVDAGAHIDCFNGGNLLLEQNYLKGIKNMGFEFQSMAKSLVVQDNWFESPSYTSLSGSSGPNSMAYSLIWDKSANITIRRNVAIMPIKGTTGKDYTRITFEVGGDNTLVEDNYSYGGNHVVAMNDGVGTASVTVKNNKFLNYAQGIQNAFPSSTRTLTQSNNGNIRLSNVMEARLAARDLPGIGSKRYDGSVTTPTTPPPVVDPTPTPTPIPTPVPPATPIPLEQGVAYLSDLTYDNAINGWGPVELNESVGERPEGDGKTMTIAGRSYSKGLGVHSRSEVTYNLAGAYSTFKSDIGLDAEVGGKGSVVFEVWADGALLYTSGKMTSASGFKSVNVDVAGKQQLVLIVTNGGDDDHFDHADWANARLTPAPDPDPVPEPDPDPREPTRLPVITYLSDLTWTSATSGWGPIERNTSNGERLAGDGRVISMDGETYTNGLGVHANSSVQYALNGGYETFNADIGIDDETGGRGSVVFEVWADGEMLYASGIVTAADGYRKLSVDVSGKQNLTLIVNNAGDNIHYDHANWANARLTSASVGTAVTQIGYAALDNGAAPADVAVNDGLAADGSRMTLDGVNGQSEVVVDLAGNYTRFVSDIGVDAAAVGSAVFQVWADGELVYESPVMNSELEAQAVDVDVTGRQQLVLKVFSPDGGAADQANWTGAAVMSGV